MTPPTFDFSTPHERLDLPGGTLAYYRFGAGPDVLCVHGWPLHAATFRGLLPHLAERFTVHLLDLPGTGNSRWREPATLVADVAALQAAAAKLDLPRYGLLAHDSGGVFARHLAASDPRVRGLVLSGSEIPGHHPWQLKAYLLAARIPGAPAVLGAALARVGALRRSPLGFGGCFTDPAYVDGDFGEIFVRPLERPEVMRGQMGLLDGFDFALIDALAAVHARIKAPTLCVWGERDPFFPAEKARGMLPQFGGGASLVTIPGAKLFAHEDRPAEFAAHAVPFLEKCLGTS